VDDDHEVLPQPHLAKLADSVYAYVQPHGGWCVSNAGVLVNGEGVTLVDATATTARARLLRRRIDTLTTEPVRTLIVTHRHGDHHYGAADAAPQARVISHEAARVSIAADGLNLTQIWPDVTWGDIQVQLPTRTFSDRMTLHSADMRIELIHPGPAHTTGDTLVWLPDQRVLFAGDITFSQVTPLVMMGSISGSLRAFDLMRSLGAEVVVSGHGPVSGPEVIDANEDYLRWVMRLAADGRQRQLTPLQAADGADLGRFADWLDPERLVANVHRAYAELDGRPEGVELDNFAILADIAEFNGGKIPTCLA
jgi:cyclase